MNPEKKALYDRHFNLYLEILQMEGDRGAVLTASAFIEHKLSEIMKARFPSPKDCEDDHFFGSSGVLRNFDSKLKFAYRFHILTKEEKSFFDGFRKHIRNPFAHNFTMMSIDSIRDKFIGVLQSFSPLNTEIKKMVVGAGIPFEDTQTREIFNISMALIMTDMTFFAMDMGPKIFKVKVK